MEYFFFWTFSKTSQKCTYKITSNFSARRPSVPPDLNRICMSSLMADWSPEKETEKNERQILQGLVCSLKYQVQLGTWKSSALDRRCSGPQPLYEACRGYRRRHDRNDGKGTAFCDLEQGWLRQFYLFHRPKPMSRRMQGKGQKVT